MGGWEKFQKQKKKQKLGGGRGEKKVEIREKKNWEARGENKGAKKKTEIRPEKGQTKGVNLG